MRFKDVFSIIGPAMIGPSSSHTAGAVRIGLVASQLLGRQPEQAAVTFYGSFADTHQGHGTDLAIVGGLLGFATDDARIRNALTLAEGAGMQVKFNKGKGFVPHPNMALIEAKAGETAVSLLGASIGGGNIEIVAIDDFDVKFTGAYPTIILRHMDRPGVLAGITQLFGQESINIGYMDVDRMSRSGEAMTVMELDTPVSDELLAKLIQLPHMMDVRKIDITEGGTA